MLPCRYAVAPSPNVPAHSENGRLFHGYMKGMYMYPCDEVSELPMRAHRSATQSNVNSRDLQQEKDRMDIYHKLFLVARRETLHQLPLTAKDRVRIMDLGTGTGIWAIDMAE